MQNPEYSRWVKLSFHFSEERIEIFYEDGKGNKAETITEAHRKVFHSRITLLPVFIPEDVDQYLKMVLHSGPVTRSTANGTHPIPLPLFIEIIYPPDYLFWQEISFFPFIEDLVNEVFQDQIGAPHHIQVIRYTVSKAEKSFRLPFNIRFGGRNSWRMLDLLTQESWYKSNPDIESFGITVKESGNASGYTEQEIDILVMEAEEAKAFFTNFSDQQELNIRLLLILRSNPYVTYGAYPVTKLSIPCLFVNYVSMEDALAFLKNFFYNIIHDYPLHEAMAYARKAGDKSSMVQSILYASPQSNHTIRISSALESFKTKVNTYAKELKPGNTAEFLKKFSDKDNLVLGSRIKDAFSHEGTIQDFFNKADLLNINFNKETSGLLPLSKAESELKNKEALLDETRSRLKSIVNDKEIFQQLRKKQERKADITLDELNPSLLYEPLDKYRILEKNRRYRLNVAIGQPSAYSLVTGDIPSIDPLLPDPEGAEGHQLDIVVFPKDFTLHTPLRQTLYLPLLGGSDTVHFFIEATGVKENAQLRIALFHKNHLLQAFLMEAKVAEAPSYSHDPAMKVSLDLSASSRFSNLEELKERDLYIGLNGTGGTHSLFIKKEDLACEINNLTEELIKGAQDNYKALLADAYFDKNKNIKFSSYEQPGAKRSEEFYLQMKKFARFGADLYGHLFLTGDKEMQDRLEEIMEAKDKNIQIGKHNPNYAFPWPILYDYNLPSDKGDDSGYPVCMGTPFPAGQYKAFECDGFGCKHNPNVYTFCMEGFWGIRHRIEQVLGNPDPADFVTAVTHKDQSGIFFTSNSRDSDSDKLEKKLTASFQERFHRITHENQLMNLLWNAAERPTSLVILGHLETSRIEGEPLGPRIITFPKEDWPSAQEAIPEDRWIHQQILLNYRRTKKRWEEQPLPLVFLINCSSASIQVGSLNSIAQAFHAAGAAAVIGTECDITSGLGARFADEVLDALYNKDMELGEAIRQFNKNLFESGNPLAFVFTCYGNNNLKITP